MPQEHIDLAQIKEQEILKQTEQISCSIIQQNRRTKDEMAMELHDLGLESKAICRILQFTDSK